MIAKNFDLQTYFKRIGFDRAPGRDLDTLIRMMRRQLFSIPFENLDVQAGKEISLVPEAIVDKLVHNRRGGYCYEVNGLFAMALTALGFEYRMIACRPMFYPDLRPRTHMALAVVVENDTWLCDVGFGSHGIRAPLLLSSAREAVRQDDDWYRLERLNEREYLLQAKVDSEWTNQYGFDLWPQQWIDFAPANYLNNRHPESLFVQKLVVVQQRPDGRSILYGNRLKTVTAGKVTEQTIPAEDMEALLMKHFGIKPLSQR
ncbi:MAG: arylamine N-acetyltransferase [Candidatus Thiodiazotropha sp.]